MNKLNFLGISGSLRVASLNSLLLRAASRLTPVDVRLDVYPSLGDIPLFNPDIEASDPAPVAMLRNRIAEADALIIASPEYAHGVTGVIKNALDWMVGTEVFIDKPIALFNASPLSTFAPPALTEIVKVMSGNVIDDASIEVWVRGSKLDEAGIAANAEMAEKIRGAFAALRNAAIAYRAR